MATITRHLPRTDFEHQQAINTAKSKNDTTPPGTGPLTANTTGHQFVTIPEHNEDIVIEVPDILW